MVTNYVETRVETTFSKWLPSVHAPGKDDREHGGQPAMYVAQSERDESAVFELEEEEGFVRKAARGVHKW